MKKTKLIYIFLFVTLLFSFTNDVKALIPEDRNNLYRTCQSFIEEYETEFETGNVLFDASGYDTNCVYVRDHEDFNYYAGNAIDWITDLFEDDRDGSSPLSCVIFQIAFNDNEFKYDQLKYANHDASHYEVLEFYNSEGDTVTSNGEALEILKERDNLCRRDVYFDFEIRDYGAFLPGYDWVGEIITLGEYSDRGSVVKIGGQKTFDKPMILEYSTTPDIPEIDSLIQPKNPTSDSCADILGTEGVNIIQKIYNLVKIGIPLVLFVLAVTDMVQAIFSGSEDNMKKAQGKLTKRIIIAVAIFLIPTILDLMLDLAHDVWPEIFKQDNLCGINL